MTRHTATIEPPAPPPPVPDLKTRLEQERAALLTLSDTTEAALAAAALKLKVAVCNGDAAAATELAKAQRSLDDYREQRDITSQGVIYKTQESARAYLAAQGYPVSGGKLSMDTASGVIGRAVVNGKKVYTQKALDNYSRGMARKTAVTIPDESHKDRLVRYMAEEKRLKVEQLQGNILDAAEEEARDAAVLLGIRRHLEVLAPDRAKRFIGEIGALLTDEQRADLTARLPELIENDLNDIAEAFHRLALAGGVDVGIAI